MHSTRFGQLIGHLERASQSISKLAVAATAKRLAALHDYRDTTPISAFVVA